MMYEQAFYLTGKRGNNAFSYEDRGPEPRLYVPAVIEGTLADVVEGDEVVFADKNDEGVLQNCKGLKHFVKTHFNGVPVVIVDNHNHVFYFWYEALEQRILQRGANLVHIDAHKDARVPELLFGDGDLEAAFRYTNEVLNVGNYIIPAQKEGLLGEIQFVTGEAALEDLSFMERGNKILNIDLDFFAPDLEYISFEKTKVFILEQAKTASIITICTSPFFIEQSRSISYLNKLFD